MKMLVFLLIALVGMCSAENCERTYGKIGCFPRNIEAFPDYLVNNRDPNSENYIGKQLDWNNYEASLQELICACEKKAKEEEYDMYAVGFYGECHGGKDMSKLDQMVVQQSPSTACMNHKYSKCAQDNHAENCVGQDNAEYIYKVTQKSPVNGGYSEWSKYTECSKTCGVGTKVRERTCTKPLPQNGGNSCNEDGLEETASCKIKECPVDGGLSDWSDYDQCTASCGGGSKKRTRSCTNPAPDHGGKECEGQTEESQACAENSCPIDGGFSSWTDYDQCTASCGGGSQKRTRSCTNPAPAHGGNDCEGETEESQACAENPCPIDGGFSDWSDYSQCASSCGGGSQERTRLCNNPAPVHGGKECVGDVKESKSCGNSPCPVDGGFSDWSDYSQCSVTCAGGTQERKRKCDNPKPAHGGKECNGATSESRTCNTNGCPVSGGISSWSSYGSCSKTCGGGIKTRTRSCTNPAPANNGKRCTESTSSTASCNTQVCLGAWSCKWKYTGWNDDGGGDKGIAVYVDRHHMVCGAGKAINYFKMERNGNHDKIRYKYKCCSTQLSCSNSLKKNGMTATGEDFWSKSKTYYLDRQTAECSDQYISSFKVYRNDRNWRYEYNCCSMSYSRSCYNKHTSFSDDGSGGLVYLDRHTIDCGTDYGLSKLHLDRNSGHNKVRYSYRCCKTNQP